MDKAAGLNDADRSRITSLLDRRTVEISKIMGRDHRTIKAFVFFFSGKTARKTPERLHFKKISQGVFRNLKREMAKNPQSISKTIFDAVSAPKVGKRHSLKYSSPPKSNGPNIPKPKSNGYNIPKNIKLSEWNEQNGITKNFSNAIFTDECRATLDGTDGWARGWVLDQRQPKVRMRHQQARRGRNHVLAGIKESTLIGPYNDPEGMKIIQIRIVSFLIDSLFYGYRATRCC